MGCSSSSDQEVVNQIKEQQKRIDELIKKNEILDKRLAEYPVHSMSHLGKNTSENGSDLTILRTTIESRFNKLEKTVERIHNDFKTKMFEGVAENNVEVGQAITPHVTHLNNHHNNKSGAIGDVTLSFDFDKEPKTNEVKASASPWNDLLHDSAITPAKIATNNHITVDKDEESRTIDKSVKTSEKTPRMDFGNQGIEEEEINIELSQSSPARAQSQSKKEPPATTSKVRDNSKDAMVLKDSDIDNKKRPVTSIGDLNSKKKVPLTSTQAKGKLEELLNDEKVKKIYSDVQNVLFKKQGKTPSTTAATAIKA